MGTEKRDRQKAQRAARLEAERAAEKRSRRLKTIRNMVILAVLIVAVLYLLPGCSSSTSVASPPKGCPPLAGATTPKLDFTQAPPPTCTDPSKTYTAVIATSLGSVTIKLDMKRTPETANNFVVLARWHYYDNTLFFRTEKASGIIQGGSPHTQDNSDPGPGYTIADEGVPFTSSDYGPGTIAMANTGRPHSASAQFFLLAGEGGRYLGDPGQPGAGSYAVFGKVTAGLDVLKRIADLDDGSSKPARPVRIDHVTITKS